MHAASHWTALADMSRFGRPAKHCEASQRTFAYMPEESESMPALSSGKIFGNAPSIKELTSWLNLTSC